ncbi:TPA: hypothetical protein ACGR6T_004750 [Klebsiella aerogenes]
MKKIELKHKNLKFTLEVLKTTIDNGNNKLNIAFLVRFTFIDINSVTEDFNRLTQYHHVLFEKIESTKVDNVIVNEKYFINKYKIQFFDEVLKFVDDAKKDLDNQIDEYLEENFFDND